MKTSYHFPVIFSIRSRRLPWWIKLRNFLLQL